VFARVGRTQLCNFQLTPVRSFDRWDSSSKYCLGACYRHSIQNGETDKELREISLGNWSRHYLNQRFELFRSFPGLVRATMYWSSGKVGANYFPWVPWAWWFSTSIAGLRQGRQRRERESVGSRLNGCVSDGLVTYIHHHHTFPGSLFFPPPGGRKKRDPGNEVVNWVGHRNQSNLFNDGQFTYQPSW